MKKIINGKVYDTDKATTVGHFTSKYARNDFNFYEETLYRKRTGEYFIHGEGNAASCYSSYAYGARSSGEQIILVSYIEAKIWAQEHLDSDTFQNEFGVILEDETTELIHISIKASDAAKLRRMAQKKGCSLSSLIASFAE